MTISNITNSESSNIFQLETNSSSQEINETIFNISGFAALILEQIPLTELRTCTLVSKNFYSTIYTVTKLRSSLFLERANMKIEFIKDDFYRSQFLSEIVRIKVLLKIKEAKKDLDRITQNRNYFSKTWIVILKSEIENGDLEQAKATICEMEDPYYRCDAWFEILKHEKTDKNLERVEKILETEIIEGAQNYEDGALKYLQLWNVARKEPYLARAKDLIASFNTFEKFDFWLEYSKIIPTSKNIHAAKKHIPLFSDDSFLIDSMDETSSIEDIDGSFSPDASDDLPSFSEAEIVKQFTAAISVWNICRDNEYLKEIQTKASRIKNLSTQFKVWCTLCQVAPIKTHIQFVIDLIGHEPSISTRVETWILLFNLTENFDYIKNACDLIQNMDHPFWKNPLWLKIIQANVDHGQIEDAKIDAQKIQDDLYLTASASIVIWKGEKTIQNLQKVISCILSNEKKRQTELWLEIANVSS